MKKLLFLALPVLLTYGCKKVDSNDLKDDVPYYQSYSVAYNKTDNNTTASAFARVRDANGTKVEFSNGAGFTANNIGPTTDIFDKALYKWSFAGVPDLNFIMTKNSGAKVNNTVTLADVGNTDFSSSFPTTVSKAAGFTFQWTGDAISGIETMTIVAAADSGSTTKTLTQLNTNNTVTFSSSDLQSLKGSNLSVTMTRSKDLALDQNDGTSGGNISVKCLLKRTATLTP